MAKSYEIEKIIDGWDDFLTDVKSHPGLRTVTLESWNRCKGYGIEPSSLKDEILTEAELENKIRENSFLTESAGSYMDAVSLNLNLPHLLLLTDKDGWLMRVCGNMPEPAYTNGLKAGVNLSEKYIGNNGMGTALIREEPVLFYGDEHFGEKYKLFSSFGLPIKNNKKKLIGSFGLLLPVRYSYPEQLIIALDCASAIENRYNLKPEKDTGQQLTKNDGFIATTIHDLRYTVTAMKGLLQKTETDDYSRNNDEGVQQLKRQLDLQSELLNAFLTIHKPEKGCIASVSELIELLISRLKPLCDSRNIDIKYNSNGTVKAKIKINLFMKAIENLLTYALNSVSDNTGIIRVDLARTDEKVTISVSDNGLPAEKEILHNLFKPFYGEEEERNGVSLYMVYRIITDVHGGRIWYDNEMNKGNSFNIEIPGEERSNAAN